MSPPHSHFSSGDSNPPEPLRLKAARSHYARPSVDGIVIAPAGIVSTEPLYWVPHSRPEDPNLESVADILQGRSRHFREDSHMSDRLIDEVPGKRGSSSSQYSQEDSPPPTPHLQKRQPSDGMPPTNGIGSGYRDSLRAEKLARNQSVAIKGRTLQGWPQYSPTSSLEVQVGDEDSSEAEMSPQVMGKPPKPAVSAGNQPTTHTSRTGLFPKRLLEATDRTSATSVLQTHNRDGLISLRPSPQPSLIVNAPPPSLRSKRSNVPHPPSIASQDRGAAIRESLAPLITKSSDRTTAEDQQTHAAEQVPPGPLRRSLRKTADLQVGEHVVHDVGQGWTYGIVVNRAQKPAVKRNAIGFFECSSMAIFAVRIGAVQYSSPRSALKRAPPHSPLFLCHEYVLVSRRGLRFHAQVTALQIKRRGGQMKYFYGLTPCDPEAAQHPMEMPEVALKKLPCLVTEKHNSTLFCSASCHRAADKLHWQHERSALSE